jgi:hypothetical protein
MQVANRMSASGGATLVARVIVGLALLILVTGLWVCLWVPPELTF